MKQAKLIVKNYRCFSDVNPLEIDLAPGFTALVGKNDSGKSTFLRLFYELRNLWQILSGNYADMFNSTWSASVNYRNVSDNEEIFCNTNDRPISLEIHIVEPRDSTGQHFPVLARVIASCDRSEPNRWRFRCFSSTDLHTEINVPANVGAGKLGERAVRIPEVADIDCGDFIDLMRVLSNALYIGSFRNAINEGAAEYFDLAIGSSFISTWNLWKTGGIKSNNRATERVTKEIRQIFEFDRLEINASEALKTLHIYMNGKPYLLSEVGSGLAQFIIVFGNAAIKTPSLILIDEPELNLHPTLQMDFITALASFSTDGIIFATHSIGLSRAVAERIYSFQKEENATIVRPFEAVSNYAEFVGELSFSAFKDMGYDRILLVEGVNDVKTIQQFLRMVKKDHQTVILPLGGDQLAKGGVEAELAEFTRLSENVAALVDSERQKKDAKASKIRLAFEAVCKKLSIDICLTERRAIENYFTDSAIKSQFGPQYGSLKPYERLKGSAMPWGKADNWRIARNMSPDDIRNTDVGQFLSRI